MTLSQKFKNASPFYTTLLSSSFYSPEERGKASSSYSPAITADGSSHRLEWDLFLFVEAALPLTLPTSSSLCPKGRVFLDRLLPPPVRQKMCLSTAPPSRIPQDSGVSPNVVWDRGLRPGRGGGPPEVGRGRGGESLPARDPISAQGPHL